MRGYLFDLDGVITDTARYHYLAWKQIAQELGICFTEEINEQLKGVSREKSFSIILGQKDGISMTEQEKTFWCEKKNRIYVNYIKQMTEEEVLPGVKEFLAEIKDRGERTALGSASKNARTILKRLKLEEAFDVIVDGTMVTKAKPDPEVFLLGAEKLKIDPAQCIVFEDSQAGIEAAHRGGMKAVGIGKQKQLAEADLVLSGFDGQTPEQILAKLRERV